MKNEAKKLSQSLLKFGITSFVAHDSIGALNIWQETIKKALTTCQVVILFIDDDFFESPWTNQEIGFALGKNIPIIPIKLGKQDPVGFDISNMQALKGEVNFPDIIAKQVYDILIEKLHMENGLKDVIIQQFIDTSDHKYTKHNFLCLQNIKHFNEDEISKIIKAYEENVSLNGGWYINNENGHPRFENFLRERTGKNYVVNGSKVSIENSRT